MDRDVKEYFDSGRYEGLSELAQIYDDLDSRCRAAAESSRISCPPGCAECCTVVQDGIEASVLELLPLAEWAWDTGAASELMARLETKPERCVLMQYGRAGGACTGYRFRPLMCRLFGSSRLEHPRHGTMLYACRILKESSASGLPEGRDHDSSPGFPLASPWRLQVDNLNLRYSQVLMGVNDALKSALGLAGLRRRFSGPGLHQERDCG